MTYIRLNETTGIREGLTTQCLPIFEKDAPHWERLKGGCCQFYNCAFWNTAYCDEYACMSVEREDNKNVYFKKIS